MKMLIKCIKKNEWVLNGIQKWIIWKEYFVADWIYNELGLNARQIYEGGSLIQQGEREGQEDCSCWSWWGNQK